MMVCYLFVYRMLKGFADGVCYLLVYRMLNGFAADGVLFISV